MDLVLGPDELSVPFNFTIPTHLKNGNEVKRVGLYSSGGMDSSALMCLIMSELKATGRLETVPVTAFTIVKNEGSTYYSHRIVDKVSEHFGVRITHVNNLENDEEANAQGRIGRTPLVNTYLQNRQDMMFYIGINRMAPDDIRPFEHTLKLFYKDEQVLYKAPFLLLHKPQITDIYYKLGCEDIIQYTHSCTTQAIGPCNNCYSCSERKWGLSALGKADPGTVPPDIDDISYGNTWINN